MRPKLTKEDIDKIVNAAGFDEASISLHTFSEIQ